MSNIDLKNCAAAVAVGLGDQLNVKVQFVDSQTAYTNGSTIFIPSSVMNSDPVWVWGYLVHEAAHIRFTSFGGFESYANEVQQGNPSKNIPGLQVSSKMFHDLWNCLEDAMIERLILEPFPGVEDYLSDLRKTMVQDGTFSGPKPGMNNPYQITMSYAFYRAFFLGTNQSAYDEIYVQWRDFMEMLFGQVELAKLDDIVDRNATAKTSEENAAITRDIFYWLAEQKLKMTGDESGQSSQKDGAQQGQDQSSTGDSESSQGNSDSNAQQGENQNGQSGSKSENASSDATNQEGQTSQGGRRKDKKNTNQKSGQGKGKAGEDVENQNGQLNQGNQAGDLSQQISDVKQGQSGEQGDQDVNSEAQSSDGQSNGQSVEAQSQGLQNGKGKGASTDQSQSLGSTGKSSGKSNEGGGQGASCGLDWTLKSDSGETPKTIEVEVQKQFVNVGRSKDPFSYDNIVAAAVEHMGTTQVLKAQRDEVLKTSHPCTLDTISQTQRIYDALKRRVYAIGATQRANRRAGKRFDIRRINRIMAGDLRVFNGNVPHMEPNAHVKILIDMSGSMHSKKQPRAQNALTGAAAIYQAFQLGKATIPVTIDAFGSVPMALTFKEENKLLIKQILERSKVNLQGTSLATALIFSGMSLARQKEKRKVLLVLTDGIPGDCEFNGDVFRQVLDTLKHSGIETFFIGIGFQNATVNVLRNVIGTDHVADVQNINTLSQEMFNTIGQRMCDYLNA